MVGPRFGRRNLLKFGLAVGGVGLLAGTSVGWAVLRLHPTATGRKVLSDEEARFLDAVAEAYWPPNNALGVDCKSLDVTAKIDAHLSWLHAREQRAARAVLSAIDWWPRLSFTSTGRFSTLSLEDRIEVLRAWETSPQEARRAIPSLLRLMVGIHVFHAPATLNAMQHEFGCTMDPPVVAPVDERLAPIEPPPEDSDAPTGVAP